MCSLPSSTCNSSSTPMAEWSSESESIVVPTNASSPEQREVFDISNLSNEDLQALRKKDPFLYYSIPSVRRAELGFNDSSCSCSCSSKGLDSSVSAAAVSDDYNDKSSASTTVKRCTRVSFECHADLLLEEYLSELDEQFDEEDLARIDLQFSRFFSFD